MAKPAALAVERLADPTQQRLKAAVLADERADGGDEDRDHRRFEHSGRAAAHVLKQRLDREDTALAGRAGCKRDDRAGDDADEQHHEDIDADDAADEHEHIGDDLNEVVGGDLRGSDVGTERQHEDERERGERGGQRDVEILAELVLHRAALTVAGGDGRIGDKAQVVTEHGAAHDGGDAQRQRIAAGRGDGDGDGRDERDGADARAHCGGDKAADDEEYRDGEFRRDEREHEVGNALRARAAHDADEHTGGEEDEQHRDDVLIADAFAHQHELFIERQRAVLAAGHEQRDEEDDDDRNGIKTHRDLQHILKNKAEAQVQEQENEDRQQRRGVGSLLHDGILSFSENIKKGS